MKERAEDAKVVAHLADGKLVKGYLADSYSMDRVIANRSPDPLPSFLKLVTADSQKELQLEIGKLKALFFVRSFEGCKDYREVKFFENNPPIEGLWVKVKFHDNESTEGVVRNSLDCIVQPGFFLKPPDPRSNNRMVYVVKTSLVDFRVLAVRNTY